MKPPVMTTSLAGLGPRHQGKVRDIYDLGDHLLLVASDRMSAFDVVMTNPSRIRAASLPPCPPSGSGTWRTSSPNHVVSLKVEDFPRRLATVPGHARRPHHAGAQMPAPAGGVHRPGLFVRFRLGGVSADQGPSAACPCPRAWWSPRSCRSPSLRPLPRPSWGPTTKTSILPPWPPPSAPAWPRR